MRYPCAARGGDARRRAGSARVADPRGEGVMSDRIPTGPSFRLPDGDLFKQNADPRRAVNLLAIIAAVLVWGWLSGRQIDAGCVAAVILMSGWSRRRDLRSAVETLAFVAVILVCGSIYRR